MINNQELMIGNWVRYTRDFVTRDVQITNICSQYATVAVQDNLQNVRVYYDSGHIQPIYLTQPVLEACGFEYRGTHKEARGFEEVKTWRPRNSRKSVHVLFITSSYDGKSDTEWVLRINGDTVSEGMAHLHTLQNLIMLLTGETLKYEPKAK